MAAPGAAGRFGGGTVVRRRFRGRRGPAQAFKRLSHLDQPFLEPGQTFGHVLGGQRVGRRFPLQEHLQRIVRHHAGESHVLVQPFLKDPPGAIEVALYRGGDAIVGAQTPLRSLGESARLKHPYVLVGAAAERDDAAVPPDAAAGETLEMHHIGDLFRFQAGAGVGEDRAAFLVRLQLARAPVGLEIESET